MLQNNSINGGEQVNENSETYTVVRDMIVERFGVEEEKVAPSMTFDDLGADSLDVVELVMDIEDRFDIQFDDDRIGDLNNIADAIDYIEELKGA